MSDLPVVVVGAGPQGLAAAAQLVERGQDVIVLERGESAAAAVAEWGHVRLFSGWPELVDAAAQRLLERSGWAAPAEGYPTGREWIDLYLEPLAAALGDRVRTGTTVTGITRAERDRVVDSGRRDAAFAVHTVDADGREGRIGARAVLDASGTWATPGTAGADGLPALGERTAADRISYRIPDDVSALAGKHVLVVGAGNSAAHAVLRLTELARTEPGTAVTWVLRRSGAGSAFGGGDGDGLPQRAALGVRARRAMEKGLVEVVTGFRVAELRPDADTLTVVAGDGREIPGIAHVFALTGFRPDTSFLSELRIDLDPALEAVAGIAAEIDPNIHSCGSVGATGARELAQPEPGFFIVGAKSYGRAPTFLALTGYEQVRSVAAHLAGDHEAAARNELALPSTGVCGGSGDFDAAGGSCCAAPVLQIGARPVVVG
ncbi:MAG: flavoprotein [Microbacterium sp. 14-71-5]|jgi:thioredoxin reductase|uniref:FAD-dependent oxidoreductase n=1 Tax=Microbacterium sp. 13-71-7 TaxID=1970399 RepID=UPI000BC68C0C|nr:FAD-dependent oxidoreductase [Microbacterium sp. 13-71-7]OZB83782.1 MAG: flavoprotein [Microbacterium sp. 13-71-7]OZB89136.1 MAG: flavoprotein [Microbacterium sp. 14-71-5]